MEKTCKRSEETIARAIKDHIVLMKIFWTLQYLPEILDSTVKNCFIFAGNPKLLDFIDVNGFAGHLYGLDKDVRSDALILTDWKNRTVLRLTKYETFEDKREILMKDMNRPSQVHVQNVYTHSGRKSNMRRHISIPSDFSALFYYIPLEHLDSSAKSISACLRQGILLAVFVVDAVLVANW